MNRRDSSSMSRKPAVDQSSSVDNKLYLSTDLKHKKPKIKVKEVEDYVIGKKKRVKRD